MQKEIWFITGSQKLYGEKILYEVEQNSKKIVDELNQNGKFCISLEYKAVMKTAQEITNMCLEAQGNSKCVGVILWMHTFSPAKMWIQGLKNLQKPILHFHTQYNAPIPWDTIDMNYMNLHQSAHGGREFGHIFTRLHKNRKVIVGHWKSKKIMSELEQWVCTANAHYESHNVRVLRLGDNMRDVAVTEGDKVEAAIDLGWTVDGFGIGDLLEHMQNVSQEDVQNIVEECLTSYEVDASLQKNGERHNALLESAKMEAGLRAFLKEGKFGAFTTTFENLHGLPQLPGLLVQRLMSDGYGFAGEGDWKTAALLRCMKIMAGNSSQGTSFMEDYTYHFCDEDLVLGSHMLEVCPSISAHKPRLEIHPLGIGGKADPVRLVFNASKGTGLVASLIDIGTRFRLIINEVEALNLPKDLPKLPVARAIWKPRPNLEIAAKAWIYAGGAHHTVYTQALTKSQLIDFAQMFGIEIIVIDDTTTEQNIQDTLRWNELWYTLKKT